MYEYRVLKVLRVIDGDTVDIEIDLGFHIYKRERVRIRGINTPELNSEDLPTRGRAYEAKQFAEAWFSEDLNVRELRIKTHKDRADKYGRMLGEFHYVDDGMSFAEDILAAGLADVYKG